MTAAKAAPKPQIDADNEGEKWIDPFDLINQASADINERDGVWTIHADMTLRCGHEVGLKIARAGGANKAWEPEHEKVMRPHMPRLTRMPLSTLRQLQKPLIARLLVKDWYGWGPKKKPLPCTYENISTLLNSHEGNDHYDFIMGFAQNPTNFYAEGDREGDAKNS